jgi:outer membrane protein TolC
MKRGFRLLLLLLGMTGWQLSAQSAAATDTAQLFTLADLESLMFEYHPVMRQAALLGDQARAQVRQALGKFDPALGAGLNRKEFGNTEYYNKWTSELKVPLWLGGADLKVGYDRMAGEYLNPENYTGNPGLSGVGISIPLGQGFIIDERRRVLRQAKIMVRYAEAERVKQIISVWFEAVQDYWSWYGAWAQYRLIAEGVQLASTRFEAVRNQTLLGDKPGIDSVEAMITVQDRQQQLAKTNVELQNARLILSNHLWNAQGAPLELPADAQPQHSDTLHRPDDQSLDSLVNHAASRHPDLLKFRSKSDELEVERLFRRERLKPRLNLSGTLLSRRTDFGSYVPGYYDFGMRNYKVGIDFAFPLLLRAERGKLAEVRYKLQSLDLDIQNADRRIRNNIYTSYNALRAYETQLGIQVSSISNQQTLLSAELQKFELGESTLFLINSRESKLIDMKLKRVELVSNYQKKLAELYYKAGTRQDL